MYLIALRHLEGSAHVFVGHRYAMPFPPTSREDLRWFAGTGAELLGRRAFAAPRPILALVGLLVVAGALATWRRGAAGLGILILPGVLALIASALHEYPFGLRFALFLIPAISVLLAAGSSALHRRASPGWRCRSPPCLLRRYSPFRPWTAVEGLVGTSRQREEIAPALAHLKTGWRPGDSLFVTSGAEYVFRFYAGGGRPQPKPRRLDATVADRAHRGPDGAAPALVSQPPSLRRSGRGGRPGQCASTETLGRLEAGAVARGFSSPTRSRPRSKRWWPG